MSERHAPKLRLASVDRMPKKHTNVVTSLTAPAATLLMARDALYSVISGRHNETALDQLYPPISAAGLSREQFDALIDELIVQGWIARRGAYVFRRPNHHGRAALNSAASGTVGPTRRSIASWVIGKSARACRNASATAM
jgi:hypothetical protein